jgi:hypothetical protein
MKGRARPTASGASAQAPGHRRIQRGRTARGCRIAATSLNKTPIKNPRSKLRGIGGRKEADQKNAASCGEYVPKEIKIFVTLQRHVPSGQLFAGEHGLAARWCRRIFIGRDFQIWYCFGTRKDMRSNLQKRRATMPEEQIIEELPAGPPEGGGGGVPGRLAPASRSCRHSPLMASHGRRLPSCSACAIGFTPWKPRCWRRECTADRLAVGTSPAVLAQRIAAL